jgi:hypothetical protein
MFKKIQALFNESVISFLKSFAGPDGRDVLGRKRARQKVATGPNAMNKDCCGHAKGSPNTDAKIFNHPRR